METGEKVADDRITPLTEFTDSAKHHHDQSLMTLSNDRDRTALARLGKKQVLRRNFGFVSMLGFSCTVLVTWEGVFGTLQSGFENGGPAGLIYGYIVVWAGTFATFVSISELSSIAPTAGGQYHWVYLLAPPSSRKFLSYLTGWMTLVAWQAVISSNCYLTARIVKAMIILNNLSYEPQLWHSSLIAWAGVIVCVFVNTVAGGILPVMGSCVLVIHIVGFIAILVVLTYLAPHGAAEQVFMQFLNEGGWPSNGVSTLVGMIGPAYAFVGADSAVHMSEEVSNPALNVPRTIILSMVINGCLGFGILIATLFGMGSIDDALNTPTQLAFVEIFTQATDSIGGGTALSAIIMFMILAAAIGASATSSRMIWAFARDDGLPFSAFLSKVHSRSSLPLNSVAVTTIVAWLLLLISLGSSTALDDVLSLSLTGFYSTYFAACALLLWRRCTGGILNHPRHAGDKTMITDSSSLYWGEWRLPQPIGIAINIFACCYLVVVTFFSMWPPATPTTPESMNYSSVVTSAIVVFSIVYYAVYAKHKYNGPVVEIDAEEQTSI